MLICLFVLAMILIFYCEKESFRSNLIYNANLHPIPYTGKYSTHFVDNPAQQLDDMLAPEPEPQIKYKDEVIPSLSKMYYCSGSNWNGKRLQPCFKQGKWTCCGDNDYDVNWNIKDDLKISDGGPCRNIYGYKIKNWREVKNNPGICYIKRSSFPSDTNYYPGQQCCRFLDKSKKYCVINFNKEKSIQNLNSLLHWGDTCKFDVI